MPKTRTKLVELVGGAADGECIRIPSYATTIGVPMGSGNNYKELIYTQDAASPQKYKHQAK
jgi:hypothetical protein